jgi:hypothetical protein
MGITNLFDFGAERNPWTDLVDPEKQPVARTIVTKHNGKIQSYFIPAPETHQSQQKLHLVIKEDDIDFTVESPERTFQFKKLEDGSLAEQRDNNLIVHMPLRSNPIILESTVSDSPLCSYCKLINFHQLQMPQNSIEHHQTFGDLCICAKQCPLCALMVNSISHHKDVTFDDLRRISLQATNDRGRPDHIRGIALNSLLITFPTIERGYEDLMAVRQTSLELTTNYSMFEFYRCIRRSFHLLTIQ